MYKCIKLFNIKCYYTNNTDKLIVNIKIKLNILKISINNNYQNKST